MSDIIELTADVPVLTLDAADEAPLANLTQEDADVFRNTGFSEDEIKQISEFSEKINLHDTETVLNYGVGAQKRLAEFSDAALEHVRTKDLDELGGVLAGLVTDLKYDPDEEKGVLGIFKKGRHKADTVRAHYAKVESNLESVVKTLEGHQITLTKDIAVLDQLYEKNRTYFRELSMYIAAGKLAHSKAVGEELPALQARAAQTGNPEDAQEANDFAALCERFEKKLYDIELTRSICLQNAPQIRLVQNNAVIMSDKINTAIVNTIPLWKNQMVISLGLAHSKEAIKAQTMVTDATNEMLKRNAELLHQTSVETAKANERGIVDMETLQETNAKLITTLDEIAAIQEEGRTKRKEAETELSRMEESLKKKLLEVSSAAKMG
ncbi:MAG: toxic anion resistance protein [Anaerovoracaceae bacterium]|nr:toxic anion resistance protein [Anaerovoracaceae bacterium]